MILSRTLAKGRIARSERPGPAAAWGPVLVDAGLTVAVLIAAYRLAGPWFFGLGLTPLTMGIALFAALYIPFHGVVVLSTIWAVRSRFLAADGPATNN